MNCVLFFLHFFALFLCCLLQSLEQTKSKKKTSRHAIESLYITELCYVMKNNRVKAQWSFHVGVEWWFWTVINVIISHELQSQTVNPNKDQYYEIIKAGSSVLNNKTKEKKRPPVIIKCKFQKRWQKCFTFYRKCRNRLFFCGRIHEKLSQLCNQWNKVKGKC